MIIGIDAEVLSYSKTGIGEYLYQIIKKLNLIDNENQYILYSNKQIYFDFKLNENWKIKLYNCKHLATWRFINLPKLLKKDGVDVLWGPRFYLPRKCRRIRYVATIHDLITEKFPETRQSKKEIIMHKFFMKSVCKNAKEIIVDSENTKKDLVDVYKVNENRVKVVYLGSNVAEKNKINNYKIEEIEKKFKINNRNRIYFFYNYNRAKKKY